MTRVVEVDSSGIRIHDGGTPIEQFRWGAGNWSVQVWDGRLSADHIAAVPPRTAAFTPVYGPRAVLRLVSLAPADRDQDRELMGLRTGVPSDNILLTDPGSPGEVVLRFGPLHVRHAPLTSDEASRLISEAFQRGLEVRQWVTPHAHGYAVVSEVTTRIAADTPAVVSKL